MYAATSVILILKGYKMASNRRSREARLLEPLLARRPNELPDSALGPTINDLYQAIAAHKAGHDHDWIYFTKDEIINMWLGAYNPNIVIPAIPGAGILFDGNIVKVDTARDYSWLGNHTFTAPIVGTISNATDADKLDGSHASAFAVSGHNHDTAYLGKTATATDSDKVDGYHASSIFRTDFPQVSFTANGGSTGQGDLMTNNITMSNGYDQSFYMPSYGVPAGSKFALLRVGCKFLANPALGYDTIYIHPGGTSRADIYVPPMPAGVYGGCCQLCRINGDYIRVTANAAAGISNVTIAVIGFVR